MKTGIIAVLLGALMIAIVFPIEVSRVLLTGIYTYPSWVGTIEYVLFFGGMTLFAFGVVATIFDVILEAIERHHEHKAKIAKLKVGDKSGEDW